MEIALLMPSIMLSIGTFMTLSSILKLPTGRHIASLKKFNKDVKTIMDIKEDLCINIANHIEKFIKLEKSKKEKLKRNLKVANIKKTEENYVAYAISNGIVWFLIFVILSLFIGKYLIFIGIIFGIKIYFKCINNAQNKIRETRQNIEKEMYRFASTIEQESKNHRDVIKIFENFKIGTNESFKREIENLLVDMRLTSYETALIRFENSINSTMLSEIVRGLIGMLNGDDNSEYFRMLSYKFKNFELNRLEKEAQKIPGKVRKFSMLMMFCMILLCAVAITLQIVDSAGTIF